MDTESLLLSFPEMHPELHGSRTVFFEKPAAEHNVLVERGYKVIYLFQMPRNTTAEKQAYLEAKLQAVEEGTVDLGRNQLAALKLACDVTFGSKTKREEAPKTKSSDIDSLLSDLSWSSSRHTFKGNSTIQETKNVLSLALPSEEE